VELLNHTITGFILRQK